MDASTTRAQTLPAYHWFTRIFALLVSRLRSVKVRRRERSLRLCETLALGEKRLVAVIQFEQKRLLIGATSQSIELLADLETETQESPSNTISFAAFPQKGKG